MTHKRSYALERSVKCLLDSLNQLQDANLTLSSNRYQDKCMFGLHERPLSPIVA